MSERIFIKHFPQIICGQISSEHVADNDRSLWCETPVFTCSSQSPRPSVSTGTVFYVMLASWVLGAGRRRSGYGQGWSPLGPASWGGGRRPLPTSPKGGPSVLIARDGHPSDLFKSPISKPSPFLRSRGSGLQHVGWGGAQFITNDGKSDPEDTPEMLPKDTRHFPRLLRERRARA